MKVDFITTKVTDTLGTRLKAYTLEDLKATPVTIQTGENEDGTPKLEPGFLDSPERIKQLFPDAQFHWVEWREECNGRDIEKAEAMQWRTLNNGQTVAAPWRYKKSWTLTLLSDWSYDKIHYTLTEQGFDNLPDAVIYLIENLVCAWKDATYPDFTKPLTA